MGIVLLEMSLRFITIKKFLLLRMEERHDKK